MTRLTKHIREQILANAQTKSDVEESKPQLPAIQVADLNALVGLPSAE